MSTILITLLLGGVFIGYLIGYIITRAIVISTIWQWYIVETFDLDPITIAQAFGISLFISIFTNKTKSLSDRVMTKQLKEEDQYFALKEFWYSVKNDIFTLGFVLLIGWIGTFFI